MWLFLFLFFLLFIVDLLSNFFFRRGESLKNSSIKYETVGIIGLKTRFTWTCSHSQPNRCSLMDFSGADTPAPPTHHTAVQCYQFTLSPQPTSSVTDTASVLFPCTKIFLKPLKMKVSPSFSLCVGSSWNVFGIKTRGTRFLFYFQRKKMEAEQHIL